MTGQGPSPGPLPPLVAIAHGSRDPRAAVAIGGLLDRVRERAWQQGLPGLEVMTAYLDHAPPAPAQVFAALHGLVAVSDSASGAWTGASGARAGASDTRRGRRAPAKIVTALPLLLTDAYHTKTDIPAILRTAAATLPGLLIRYAEPLGPHPLLLGAMERQLAEAGVAPGDRDVAVVLAAAGSTDPAATAVIRKLAGDWQARRGWRAVLPAFASAASPSPAEAVSAARGSGARQVVVASYLLAPGLFADEVRQSSLAAGASAVLDVLAAAPELADLVIYRYLAASPRTIRPRAAAAG